MRHQQAKSQPGSFFFFFFLPSFSSPSVKAIGALLFVTPRAPVENGSAFHCKGSGVPRLSGEIQQGAQGAGCRVRAGGEEVKGREGGERKEGSLQGVPARISTSPTITGGRDHGSTHSLSCWDGGSGPKCN